MENINAEIFTLRNQRKLIKGLTDKLKIVLGQFDQLENELIRSQYKSGLMIAFDEIGYDEEMYMKRIKELFDIKQKYHHLWNETQQLYNSTQKHFNSEKILMENLINKINNLTPDKIDGIKLIKKNKQKKKKNIFNDLSNLKNEIDNLEKVKNDLIGMREFVSGNSNKAYYSKEVKDFNSITDKISSEKKKLEQYKKINNSKMIITTNVMITSLENDKKKIIKGTKEAIEETLVSLDSKVLERKKIADKYFKIKKIRILIQGLPWSGKFSMIYAIDPYSAIQRKGNYMVLKAPDYIFSTFKGLMVWVKDKDSKINTGKLVSLPDFEEGFNDFRERIKVKIELTCATGYVDDKIFPKIINGMKFDGLCFMYDYSDDNKFEEVKKLFKLTKNALSMNKIKDFQILILANKKDLVNSSSKKPKLENSNFISIKENQDEFNLIFEKFINELLIKSDKIKNLINIELE